MYRRLESKPSKLFAKEPTPESACKCQCTSEKPKDADPAPAANNALTQAGNHYDIGGK